MNTNKISNNTIPVTNELRARIIEALKGNELDLSQLPELQALGGIRPFTIEIIDRRDQVNDGNDEDEPTPDIIELSAELKKKLLKAVVNKGELDPADFPEITARPPKIQVVDSMSGKAVDVYDELHEKTGEDDPEDAISTPVDFEGKEVKS